MKLKARDKLREAEKESMLKTNEEQGEGDVWLTRTIFLVTWT